MLKFIIGFITCWIILAIIAYFSETKNNGGICLFDGWAVTILLLPILLPCWIVSPFYTLYKIIERRIKK